jgi:hypothetical protein
MIGAPGDIGLRRRSFVPSVISVSMATTRICRRCCCSELVINRAGSNDEEISSAISRSGYGGSARTIPIAGIIM